MVGLGSSGTSTGRSAPRLLSLAGLLFVLLAGAAALPAAEALGPQTWYLSSTTENGFRHMFLGANTGGSAAVSVAPGAPVTWIYPEAALASVNYGQQTWNAVVRLGAAPLAGTTATFEVGRLTTSNIFVSAASSAQSIAGQTTFTPTMTPPSINPFVISTGEHLAFRMSVAGASTVAVQTDPNGAFSTLNSAAGAPDFPVPELASLALLGAGLVVVGGAWYARRRGA